jgi:hypothetical protein
LRLLGNQIQTQLCCLVAFQLLDKPVDFFGDGFFILRPVFVLNLFPAHRKFQIFFASNPGLETKTASLKKGTTVIAVIGAIWGVGLPWLTRSFLNNFHTISPHKNGADATGKQVQKDEKRMFEPVLRLKIQKIF